MTGGNGRGFGWSLTRGGFAVVWPRVGGGRGLAAQWARGTRRGVGYYDGRRWRGWGELAR